MLLADAKQIVWYRAPNWEKFVMAENLTPKDNVSIAARDLDGDGKAEVAVGAEWNPSDTVNSGAVLGLHDLGLLCHPLRGEREEKVQAVANAMEVFASKVEESFTAEEREEMGWDVIVMEHSLCKFHRFLSLLT